MNDTDKKIETQLLNNLKALKTALPTMDLDELRSELTEKLDTCTKSEYIKLLKKIISWEEEHLNYDLIDQDVLNES
jgi:hypothetical protein